VTTPFLNLPGTNAPARVLGSAPVAVGHPVVLADLKGPGCIRRIWVTHPKKPQHADQRQVIIRMYWDDQEVPAVEAPIGDFFGLVNGVGQYPLRSRYLFTQGLRSTTAYFQMPFEKSARIEIEAGPDVPQSLIHWQIDWHRYPPGSLEETQRFHAKFRREFPCEAYGRNYLILDAVGKGRLIGFNYGVRLYDDRSRWSHAGGDSIYIVNNVNSPQGPFAHLHGGGGEESFGGSYGGVLHEPSTHLDQGIPYYVHEDTGAPRAWHRLAGYRFFHHDSITFDRSIQMRFGSMANDICSTAYWYQIPPHREFFRLPSWEELLPGAELKFGTCDLRSENPRWWLCGPFHPGDEPVATYKLPPETDQFDPPKSYADTGYPEDSIWREDDRHIARWVRYGDIDGFVDFTHVFRPITPRNGVTWPAIGLAMTSLIVDADTKATIQLGWTNDLSLQINDGPWQSLGVHEYFRTANHDVQLAAGVNRIRLKLNCPDDGDRSGFSWGSWIFAFRAVLPNGEELVHQLMGV